MASRYSAVLSFLWPSDFQSSSERSKSRSADYLVASGNLLLETIALLVAIKLKMCVHLLVSSLYSLLWNIARRMILLSFQASTYTEFSVAGLWG